MLLKKNYLYSAVDFMAAPTPATPAVFSRAQEIVPLFVEDNDIIASVPEVRINAILFFKCNELHCKCLQGFTG